MHIEQIEASFRPNMDFFGDGFQVYNPRLDGRLSLAGKVYNLPELEYMKTHLYSREVAKIETQEGPVTGNIRRLAWIMKSLPDGTAYADVSVDLVCFEPGTATQAPS